MRLKEKIIKMLGGYTEREYRRSQQKYKALLDSKTDNSCIAVANEAIYITLHILLEYAKKELYGLSPNKWCERMYNVIHNNFFRILIRYQSTNSSIIYHLDTTLNEKDEFKRVLREINDEEGLDIINKMEKNDQL